MAATVVSTIQKALSKEKDNAPEKQSTKASDSAMQDDFLHGTTAASCHLKIRMGFIRKVYGIVAAQLILTIAIAALFMSFPWVAQLPFQKAVLNVCMVASLVLIGLLGWKRHEYPLNMGLLFAFTFVEAYIVGFIVTLYETTAVLQALVLTTGIVCGLTLYAFQTKYDWTFLNSTLIIVCWTMFFVGLMQVFFPFGSGMELLFSICGAILFSMFIVVDTQLLMNKLSSDEYILCAVNLYLDIVNLFLYILRILNSRK